MITTSWPTPGRPRSTHFIKRQADFLQAAGVEVDVFQFEARKSIANYLRAWWRAQPLLRSGRYDLVHAQFGQSGLPALPKRLPLVVTLRGSDLLGIVGPGGRYTLAGRFAQALTRLVARNADAVIAVSDHMKEYLPPNMPVTIVPSGLNLTLFRPIPRGEARRHLGLPADKRLVLFAGNPAEPRKRYDLARRAVDALNGSMAAELLVAWGVPHQDMPHYMGACDAMVFTSMQEGSPNVVKEALACNLPVVSVPVGDVEQRLANVAGCELVRDEQPEAIAAGLERVLRRGGRVKGRETVEQLDEVALTRKVIALYQDVLARARRPARVSEGRAETADVGA
jgi:teichuronic acid biosynthesis glycosyltransferase TuaC